MHRVLLVLSIGLLFSVAEHRRLHAQDAVPIPIKGTTYFVNNSDAKASDSNDGRVAQFDTTSGSGPWKTIGKATQTMSGGDATKVHAGTYKERNVRFGNSGTADAPIQLLSADPTAAVILDGSNTPDAIGIQFTNGRSHIVIDGLTIQNMPRAGIATDEGTRIPFTNLVLRNLRLRQNGQGLELSVIDRFTLHCVRTHNKEIDGLRLQGSPRQPASGGRIVDCRSYDNGSNGLTVLRGKAIVIANSTFSSNGNLGVQIGDEGHAEHMGQGITIKSCTSHNNQGDGFSLFTGSQNNVLEDSEAYKNRRFGFLVLGSEKNEIRRNTALGNTEEGFVLIHSSHNTLSNNVSHHHGVNGFSVTDRSSQNTLSNNESHSNGMRGFLVSGQATSNTIRKNNAHHNMILGFGVYEQAKNNLFEDNNIHDNIYHAFALLHDAHENHFVGNVVHHNNACGFYVETSRKNRFTKNVLHHNKLDGFAVLHESTGNVFQENTAHDNKVHGFLSDSSSVQAEWSQNNKAKNNAQGDFAIIDIEDIQNLRAYTK